MMVWGEIESAVFCCLTREVGCLLQICVVGDGVLKMFRYQDGNLKTLVHVKMAEPQNFLSQAWVSETQIVVGTDQNTVMLFEGQELKAEFVVHGDNKSDGAFVIILRPVLPVNSLSRMPPFVQALSPQVLNSLRVSHRLHHSYFLALSSSPHRICSPCLLSFLSGDRVSHRGCGGVFAGFLVRRVARYNGHLQCSGGGGREAVFRTG
jgi:hypothetical protein